MDFEAAIERLRSLNLSPSMDNGDGEFEVLTGQMVPAREDQVENNAGGFVFQVSDETRVRRFLILGVSSGTYYVNKADLETKNVKDLVDMIEKGRGDMILKELHDVISNNRAPKRDPAIYVLALCARFHSKNWQELRKEKNGKLDRADEYIAELQRAAFRLLPTVCRIPTDLFAFLGHCEKIAQEHNAKTTGWGRLMRKAIEQWYLNKPPMQLANQITKYKNRNNYTHKDALRLCHADPKNAPEKDKAAFYDYIFHYAVNGKLDKKFDGYDDTQTTAVCESDVAKFLSAIEVVSKLKPEDEEKCAQLIYEFALVREHCPTDLLNSAVVWKALFGENAHDSYDS
ncbi:TROVE domain protein [Aphelenchoides besseyi]|nr:TROVE domain protein [Aphelenchoides besseyi]